MGVTANKTAANFGKQSIIRGAY